MSWVHINLLIFFGSIMIGYQSTTKRRYIKTFYDSYMFLKTITHLIIYIYTYLWCKQGVVHVWRRWNKAFLFISLDFTLSEEAEAMNGTIDLGWGCGQCFCYTSVTVVAVLCVCV